MSATSPLDLQDIDDGLDEAEVARIERNIDGAFDCVRAVIADPALLERVPAGAAIALAYDDDPVLSAENLKAAGEIEESDGLVYVHRVMP